jgi:predicted transcriptional regulator
MRRKTKEPMSNMPMSFRVTQRQYDDLMEVAAQDRDSLSAIIREAISEYTARRMCNLVPDEASETVNRARPSFRLRYAR